MENFQYAPQAQNDFFFAVIGSPWGWLAVWLIVINVAAFCAFGIDKWKAKHPGRRRIPERNLMLSALAGGSIGALLGMKVFHHKTLHKLFSIGVPVILAVPRDSSFILHFFAEKSGMQICIPLFCV